MMLVVHLTLSKKNRNPMAGSGEYRVYILEEARPLFAVVLFGSKPPPPPNPVTWLSDNGSTQTPSPPLSLSFLCAASYLSAYYV